MLARTFDEMRLRLKESLEKIQAWNRELESRVQRRTRRAEGVPGAAAPAEPGAVADERDRRRRQPVAEAAEHPGERAGRGGGVHGGGGGDHHAVSGCQRRRGDGGVPGLLPGGRVRGGEARAVQAPGGGGRVRARARRDFAC